MFISRRKLICWPTKFISWPESCEGVETFSLRLCLLFWDGEIASGLNDISIDIVSSEYFFFLSTLSRSRVALTKVDVKPLLEFVFTLYATGIHYNKEENNFYNKIMLYQKKTSYTTSSKILNQHILINNSISREKNYKKYRDSDTKKITAWQLQQFHSLKKLSKVTTYLLLKYVTLLEHIKNSLIINFHNITSL